MNETPANTAREDSPASGASPDGQVPGKILDPLPWPVKDVPIMFVYQEPDTRYDVWSTFGELSEPIPADDEQVEGAA